MPIEKQSKSIDKKRSRTIINAGYLFIIINFILGIFNILIGIVSGSIAITSDAIHSFIDSVSGFLVIISEKLASHHKFNHRREQIERITTIAIATIIIIAGVHIIVDSIEKLLNTEPPDYSIPVIIVLIASIALKYTLARYLSQTDRKIESTVLTASAAETLNDTWISIAVLASALIYLITNLNIEAFISLIIAILIIKVGLEFIFPHISKHHHHHLESDPDHDHCNKKS